ncbi:MAG: thiamine-phosphate synthase family protein [Nitrososphaerales archaeon]
MIKEFLPAVRGLVAHKLREKKISQVRMARMLGVTQAAISQYLSKKFQYYLEKLNELGIKMDEGNKIAKLLCEDLLIGQVDAIRTLYTIWRRLLADGILCHAHKRLSLINEDCDICMKLFKTEIMDSTRFKVLEELKKAVRIIEASPYFPYIMPEVSVNIALAITNATTEADIAAIPGRIGKVHGRAKAMMDPEFGASRHMAKMLLCAMHYDKNIKAVINVKYDEKIDKILNKMGYDLVYINQVVTSPRIGIDVVVESFNEALSKLRRVSKIVIHKGGIGIEPMTYIFGKCATEIAEEAVEIASRYIMERIS